MEFSALQFWLILSVLLIFGEFILPGLVSVFVGLGALTTAAALYWGLIDSMPSQLLVLCLSSTVYIFSLRFIALRFVPTDTHKGTVDEDALMIGQKVKVFETIGPDTPGRISLEDSTWPAKSADGAFIPAGEIVEILGRENITWLVRPLTSDTKES